MLEFINNWLLSLDIDSEAAENWVAPLLVGLCILALSVIEVALASVKVQNWDKTIITIPAYSLVSESFKNWRSMQESGERRVKWSLLIDIQTIKFCDEKMLTRFSKIKYIAAYIERKKDELAKFNQEQAIDESSLVNGQRMTNVGMFRAYIVAYLRNHPEINREMTFFVRQLAPGEHGLPIEIYFFHTVWANAVCFPTDKQRSPFFARSFGHGLEKRMAVYCVCVAGRCGSGVGAGCVA